MGHEVGEPQQGRADVRESSDRSDQLLGGGCTRRRSGHDDHDRRDAERDRVRQRVQWRAEGRPAPPSRRGAVQHVEKRAAEEQQGGEPVASRRRERVERLDPAGDQDRGRAAQGVAERQDVCDAGTTGRPGAHGRSGLATTVWPPYTR
jgi:hypothetical protein